jgi:hypothetical protein
MRRERDNRIIFISPGGARDIVKMPTVFEGARYPERIVLQGFNLRIRWRPGRHAGLSPRV